MKNYLKIKNSGTIAPNIAKLSLTAIILGLTLNLNAQSPTAPALDFNVFVKNGAILGATQTYGPVAIGGDLTLTGNGNYQMAFKNAGTFQVSNKTIGLVVGGKVIYGSGNQTTVTNGYVKIGNATGSTVWYTDNHGKSSNLEITSGAYNAKPSLNLETSASALGVSATNNPVMQGGLINFEQAFTTMQTNAAKIAAYATNIDLSNVNKTKTGTTIPSVVTSGSIEVTLKTGINVLNATGAELNSVTNNFQFSNTPDATHILVVNVNAPGAFIWNVWNQPGIGITHCPYIIYNFYNTTNLQLIGNNTIEGTVFAPFADIIKTASNGHIEGQIIALSYNHTAGADRYANFIPTLPENNIAVVTAPTVVATSPVYTNKGIKSVSFSCTPGNGSSRIIIAKKGSEPGSPNNGQSYNANASYGSGASAGSGFVVYNGTGSSVTITNLESKSTYYFSVIEYNATGSSAKYATSQKLVSNVTTIADTDGDGVPDTEDHYPTDPTRAYNNYFPSAATAGTLMYEDAWPYKGDYDFNDFVVNYKINTVTNAANNIVEVIYAFVPKAAGATLKDGFAFQLDNISPTKIQSVTGTRMTAGWSALNSNGTEAGHTNHTNIIVFENALNVFNGTAPGLTLINTFTGATKFIADTIKVVVTFKANELSYAGLSITQFNPYLIANNTRGREIHLADRMPSTKMDANYFGQGIDKSNISSKKYFKSSGNLPWALNFVEAIPYALENVDITKAYLNMIKWASSNGSTNKDWYQDLSGYRNNTKLYKK